MANFQSGLSRPTGHVLARRIADRLELAAAGLARRHLLAAREILDPAIPVAPPGALDRLGAGAPLFGVFRRVGIGPVAVFLGSRRVDHAGEVAGRRKREAA